MCVAVLDESQLLHFANRMAAAGAEAAAKQLRLAAGIKLHPALVPGAVHELCKQVVTPELNSVVTELLGKVRMFHDRAAAKNAIKVRVEMRKQHFLCYVPQAILAVFTPLTGLH